MENDLNEKFNLKGSLLKKDVKDMVKIKLSGCDSIIDHNRKNICKNIVYTQSINDLKTKGLLCKNTKCAQTISNQIMRYVTKIQQLNNGNS